MRSRGLEPPRVAPLAPQASASTNSATTASGRTPRPQGPRRQGNGAACNKSVMPVQERRNRVISGQRPPSRGRHARTRRPDTQIRGVADCGTSKMWEDIGRGHSMLNVPLDPDIESQRAPTRARSASPCDMTSSACGATAWETIASFASWTSSVTSSSCRRSVTAARYMTDIRPFTVKLAAAPRRMT